MTQVVTSPSGHVIINTFGDLSDTSPSLQSAVHAVKTAGNGPEAGLHCRTFSNQARQFERSCILQLTDIGHVYTGFYSAKALQP